MERLRRVLVGGRGPASLPGAIEQSIMSPQEKARSLSTSSGALTPDAHPAETTVAVEFGAIVLTEQLGICAAFQVREADRPLR